MQLLRVKWGKLSFEVPGEIFFFLLLRAFLMLTSSRFTSPLEWFRYTQGSLLYRQ
jgi:hypothetical protein